MAATPDSVKQILQDLDIAFQEFLHPPVYTCEEAQRLCPPMPGVREKNLFLRDKKGKRYYFVSLPWDKQLDLKSLSDILGVKGLSFASEQRLMNTLGIKPGSVGILALINDTDHLTSVYIHKTLLESEWFQSHPFINTSTICFKTEGLSRWLEHTGHELHVLKV